MKVFLYGTLMRGGRLHDTLRHHRHEFLGEAVTAEPMRMLEIEGRIGADRVSYPALLPDPDGDACVGELYRCRPALIDTLDAIEGVRRREPLYERRIVAVVAEDLKEHRAFAYLWVAREGDGLRPRVAPSDGVLDWRAHRRPLARP